VRPISKNLHRRINRLLAELLWLELVWIFDWWAGVKVFKFILFLIFVLFLYF
jgi:lysophosphatidic acid acyltransferase/lysophosphatidylinositol acyltransferase